MPSEILITSYLLQLNDFTDTACGNHRCMKMVATSISPSSNETRWLLCCLLSLKVLLFQLRFDLECGSTLTWSLIVHKFTGLTRTSWIKTTIHPALSTADISEETADLHCDPVTNHWNSTYVLTLHCFNRLNGFLPEVEILTLQVTW